MDVVSVHEIGRRGLSDSEQLRFAIQESRILVTRNRDDFRYLVETLFRAGDTVPGVLIAPYSLPNKYPERIAYALRQWADRRHHGDSEFHGIGFLAKVASE